MKTLRFDWLGFLISLLFLVSLACGAAVPSAAPTNTAVPPTPTLAATITPVPTWTPPPSATPDLAATQEIESRQAMLQAYADKGYIPSASGDFAEIDDFHEEWAKLGWYQFWPIDDPAQEYGDLVFHGHFAWEAASSTPELSGCGIIFGLQPNMDHYAVFVDRGRIAFMMTRGGKAYQVGKTSGSGRLNLQAPFAADVDVIIQGATTYVVVNGAATRYTLSADQTSKGVFALSLLSGTNKDYGTRCSITNAYLWLPQE